MARKAGFACAVITVKETIRFTNLTIADNAFMLYNLVYSREFNLQDIVLFL
jgi:hypothetical protein